MKASILTFISVLVLGTAIAGNGNLTDKESTRLISGKVIDKDSGEEIAGAEIKIADKIIYTDLNGNFITSIPVTTTSAVVSFISYSNTTIALDPHAYGEVLVALETE